MEKIVTWFILWTKFFLKRKSTWCLFCGMIMVVLLISNIHIPTKENIRVGVYCGDSQQAKKIYEGLCKGNSAFEFEEFTDIALMKKQILAGNLESAFIFDKNYDQVFQGEDMYHSIECIITPYSMKHQILKETVYAQVFRQYSEVLLRRSENEIFKKSNSKRMEKILKANQKYLNGDDIYQVHIQEIEGEFAEKNYDKVTYPVQGLIGIIIFMTMLLAAEESGYGAGKNFLAQLSGKNRLLYRYTGLLASVSVLVPTGLICVWMSGQSRGVYIECGRIILFVVCSGIWILLVERLAGKRGWNVSWVLALLIVNLMIHPVFFDVAKYVEAIKYLRYLLPLKVYI